jgi:hypothetical protein
MDIIYEVQEAINDGLSPKHIKKYVLKDIRNEEYCDILIEDCKLVENIYKNFIIKHIELPANKKDINKIKNNINRKISEEIKELEANDPLFLQKLKMIKYMKIIKDYIDQSNFIQIYINDNIENVNYYDSDNDCDSDSDSDNDCDSDSDNPYMKARSALVKVIFAKAKAKEVKLSVPKSAKIIEKIEEEIIQKHKLTDKVEILNKALEHFNSNVDKYLV